MITLSTSVNIDMFKRQAELFDYSFNKVGHDDKLMHLIVDRNEVDAPIDRTLKFNISNEHRFVSSVYDVTGVKEAWLKPLNLFTSVSQVLSEIDDEEVLEIIDADMVQIRPYQGPIPEHDEVVAETIYETWHMNISHNYCDNFKIVEPYLNHDDYRYMNGGFNIILTAKTLKKLMPEIIDRSIDIGLKYTDDGNRHHSWWQCMYAVNIACHNHRINMIGVQSSYVPDINYLTSFHHIGHYSVDKIYDKHNGVKDLSSFPDNYYYNTIKEWLSTQSILI